MSDQFTRRTVAAGGFFMLAAGPALAKPGHIRTDLYGWEGGRDPKMEYRPETIPASARIAPDSEPGTPLVVTGRVTSWDRDQPVKDVVVYAYQTNIRGIYERVSGTRGSDFRMRLRGWARTGADGRYTFHTIKPGMYPSREQAPHIHLTVFEPGRRPYWIDDVMFEGDPGLTHRYVQRLPMRGGPGVVRLARDSKGVLWARRDIRLERHPA